MLTKACAAEPLKRAWQRLASRRINLHVLLCTLGLMPMSAATSRLSCAQHHTATMVIAWLDRELTVVLKVCAD